MVSFSDIRDWYATRFEVWSVIVCQICCIGHATVNRRTKLEVSSFACCKG